MSEDPVTREQIAALKLGGRPLVVLDVDEVVLEFVGPFGRFLESEGYRLKAGSFRLTGNIFGLDDGEVAGRETVGGLLDRFFVLQADWQKPAEGAVAGIARLAEQADVVLLTAMPHRHFAIREPLLRSHGVDVPLVTTETAKGPAIAAMRSAGMPVAFVDDLPGNLLSARQTVEDIHLVHLMAAPAFRAFLPSLPEGIFPADDWPHAVEIIEAAFTP